MARRKKGNPVNGWVILDKPIGITSTQAVSRVRRLYNAQKAGHAGTLDPLASGILPIALGEATKTVPFTVDGEKAYRFTVRWGADTNTDDAEGTIIRTSDRRPTRRDIEHIVPMFVGEIMQVPPQFSAIKVDGERAYALARDGEEVVLNARPVVIETLDLVALIDDQTAVFEAQCGKGTYVRSIARDMGRELGCCGHVIELRRTRVGHFAEDRAVTLDSLHDAADADAGADASGGDGQSLWSMLLPIEAALDDITALPVSSDDAQRLRNGQSVLIRGRDAPIMTGPAYAISKGQLVAIGELARGELHPTRVFNFE
jgi:tRNA pseudouridine55 synthase